MIKAPDKLSKGPVKLVAWLNSLRDFSVAIRPLATEICDIDERPDGSRVLPKADAIVSSSRVTHPLKCIDASEDETPKIKVVYGTVHYFIPLMDGMPLTVSLSDVACPTLTLTTSTKCIYVQLDLNGSQIPTGCSIHSTNDTAPPDSTTSTAYVALCGVIVTVDAGAAKVVIADNVETSLVYQYCGGSHLFGRLS